MRPLLIFKSYVWLISLLRDRGSIKLSDIQDEWLKGRLGEGKKLSRQRFIRYKSDLEELFGIEIAMDKQYYYYIKKVDTLQKGTVINWMMSTIGVDLELMEHPEVYDYIVLEDIPSAGKYLKDIVDSMAKKRKIDVRYKRYDKDNENDHLMAPLFVKLYHQRWYLLGQKDDGVILTLGLDRIKELKKTKKRYKRPKGMSAYDYFKDCYGVMKDESKPAERIVLRAYGTEVKCLQDLKLHHSQKLIAMGQGYADFELFVHPSWDIRGKIMERGRRLEVLEPCHFADEIAEELLETVKRYKLRRNSSEV